jgi:hypothetical protein
MACGADHRRSRRLAFEGQSGKARPIVELLYESRGNAAPSAPAQCRGSPAAFELRVHDRVELERLGRHRSPPPVVAHHEASQLPPVDPPWTSGVTAVSNSFPGQGLRKNACAPRRFVSRDTRHSTEHPLVGLA